MKVTEKEVAYVADLANIELGTGESAGLVRDLNSILGHIDKLNELDTSNVEPMAQVSDRYGVDNSKQGCERFSYGPATTLWKDCANLCRKMLRWKMRRIPTEYSSAFLK